MRTTLKRLIYRRLASRRRRAASEPQKPRPRVREEMNGGEELELVDERQAVTE